MSLLLTFVPARKTERHESADNAEDFDGMKSDDFTRLRIGPQNLYRLSARNRNLLDLRAGEIAMHGAHDAGGALQRHAVKVHPATYGLRHGWAKTYYKSTTLSYQTNKSHKSRCLDACELRRKTKENSYESRIQVIGSCLFI